MEKEGWMPFFVVPTAGVGKNRGFHPLLPAFWLVFSFSFPSFDFLLFTSIHTMSDFMSMDNIGALSNMMHESAEAQEKAEKQQQVAPMALNNTTVQRNEEEVRC